MNTILHPTIISNFPYLPLPADEVGAIADLKKWGATLGDVRAQQIAESGEGQLILTCIFGNSPYLANCVTHESSFLIDCLFDGVDTVFNRLLDALPKLVLGNTRTIRALATHCCCRLASFSKCGRAYSCCTGLSKFTIY